MCNLTDKKALVTGSTQGIGLEIAKILSNAGATVFVHGASSIEKCKKACEEIKNSHPVCANLCDMDSIEKIYNETGDVDILVLNASIQYKRKWDEFTLEEFDTQFNCNVKASYFLMQKFAPKMKESGWGRIITIGSVNQYNQHPELSLYGATKSAQMKLVENIAPSLAPFGVTVNNVAPGAIETPRNDKALSDLEFKKKVIGSIPAGYIGSPCDIAPYILFLCSDSGKYITGTDLIIDGGMHL